MGNMVRQSIDERMASALERIADAQTRMADADPLTMLQGAMQDVDGAPVPSGDVQAPFASNGQTYIYKHPTPGHVVVLRRDPIEPGGYVASVEEE